MPVAQVLRAEAGEGIFLRSLRTVLTHSARAAGVAFMLLGFLLRLGVLAITKA